MNKPLLIESMSIHEAGLNEPEEWRQIPGFPDYQVSSLGRVKSATKRKGSRASINGGILSCRVETMTGGYQRALVSLRKDGKTYSKKVHVLVLSAFISERPEGMVCLHINGNALDNRVSNLRWGTMRENSADSIRHGTKSKPPVHTGEKHPRATISDADTVKIRSHKFERGDQARLAKFYGVADITISRIRKGFSRALSA